MNNKNIEYVPVWRVQVWKGKHLIEAELYETEEEAEIKVEEFRGTYKEENGYIVKIEKDFLKLAKQFIHSIIRGFAP